MSTFSINELIAQLNRAASVSDLPTLLRVANELEHMGSPLTDAHAFRARAIHASVTGNVDEAFSNAYSALHLFETIGDNEGVAKVLNGIGNDYLGIGDYATSLQYYHKSLALFRSQNNDLGIALVIGNIGNVFTFTGNYTEAIAAYMESLDTYRTHDVKSGIARLQGNLGMVYARMGDAEMARRHLAPSLQGYKDLRDHNGVARVTGHLFECHLMAGELIEAKMRLDEMDAIEIDEPEHRISRCIYHSDLALKRDAYDDAQMHLLRGLDIAGEFRVREREAEIQRHLRDLAYQRNDLESYVQHNNALTMINEQIRGANVVRVLATQESESKLAELTRQRDIDRAILHSTLPKHIADRVSRGEQVTDQFDNAAVIFIDIVDFTTLSSTLPSSDIVNLLSTIFSAFDAICQRHSVTKIKTIGDSYMTVAFPSSSDSPRNDSTHLLSAANTALDMLHSVSQIPLPGGSPQRSHVSVRIGVHCGAVTAGVIGTERLQYDVWGDTVNVASRMESTGEPGRVHVSERFATFLGLRPRNDNSSPTNSEGGPVIPSGSEEPGTWHLALRGDIEIKGKGLMTTYWLERL